MLKEQRQKSGFVTIIGRPNVGKSTLMNHLIGQKISITTHKPQTTRHAITGIYTDESRQIIFLDTPGIHTYLKTALNHQLNRTAISTLTIAHAVLFVIEALIFNEDDIKVLQALKTLKKDKPNLPILLVINKIDKVEDKERLLPFIEEMKSHDFSEIIPISARQEKFHQALITLIDSYLPEQEFFYPEDEITTASRRFLASEILREKLTQRLNQELPYAITVEVESFKTDKKMDRIHAIVWVERESQKGIVIGKRGATLKEASTEAREALEKLFSTKVFLKAQVKVREGWSNDLQALHSLGYKDLS